MSYLKKYDLRNPNRNNQYNDGGVGDKEKAALIQAKFTFLKLNTYSAQSVINSLSSNVQALDLSHNKIESFPKLPKTIIGLNLSYNIIDPVNIGSPLHHLIELNLSHNRIVSTIGLSPLLNLEFLELSCNSITTVEGLENMKKLQVLKLQGNMIHSVAGLRSLSYNQMLIDIDLTGNPVCEVKELKLLLINWIPNVKIINKNTARIRGPGCGYTDIASIKHHNKPENINNNSNNVNTSMMSTDTAISQKDQLIELWRAIAHDESLWSTTIPMEIMQRIKQVLPLEEQESSVQSEQEPPPPPPPTAKRNNNLPWRKPPNPTPRPRPIKKTKSESPPRHAVKQNLNKRGNDVSAAASQPQESQSPDPQQMTQHMLDECIEELDPQETIQGSGWMSPKLQKKQNPNMIDYQNQLSPPSFHYITSWDIDSTPNEEDEYQDYPSQQEHNHSRYHTPTNIRSHSQKLSTPADRMDFRKSLTTSRHSPTRSSILRHGIIAKKLNEQKELQEKEKHRKTFATTPPPNASTRGRKKPSLAKGQSSSQAIKNAVAEEQYGDNEDQENQNNQIVSIRQSNSRKVEEEGDGDDSPSLPPDQESPYHRLLRLKNKINRRLGIDDIASSSEHGLVPPQNPSYGYLHSFENTLEESQAAEMEMSQLHHENTQDMNMTMNSYMASSSFQHHPPPSLQRSRSPVLPPPNMSLHPNTSRAIHTNTIPYQYFIPPTPVPDNRAIFSGSNSADNSTNASNYTNQNNNPVSNTNRSENPVSTNQQQVPGYLQPATMSSEAEQLSQAMMSLRLKSLRTLQALASPERRALASPPPSGPSERNSNYPYLAHQPSQPPPVVPMSSFMSANLIPPAAPPQPIISSQPSQSQPAKPAIMAVYDHLSDQMDMDLLPDIEVNESMTTGDLSKAIESLMKQRMATINMIRQR